LTDLPAAPPRIVIASRESRLAMWQAEHIQSRLSALYPQTAVEILGMTTRGDQILDRPLAQIGGKGLFIKELEVAMEGGRADLAVHSLKDVPMEMPEGFTLAAITARENPCDAFVSNTYDSLDALPAGAVVGTSSLRREAILRAQYAQLKIEPLRGNLDTRLGKLDKGEYDAIVLAAAGLDPEPPQGFDSALQAALTHLCHRLEGPLDAYRRTYPVGIPWHHGRRERLLGRTIVDLRPGDPPMLILDDGTEVAIDVDPGAAWELGGI